MVKSHKEAHLTDKYREGQKEENILRQKRYRAIKKYVDDSDKILELGCGETPFREDSFQVDLIDEVDLKHDLNQPLDLGKKFDIVMGFEIIEHLHNHKIFLETCRKHTKENGLCMLSTVNPASWRNRIALLFGWPRFCRGGHHIRFFTPSKLRELLRGFDFSIVETIPIGRIFIESLCGDFIVIAKRREQTQS